MLGRVICSGQSAKETMLWLRWADSDYQSARILLLQGFLVQGAAFSNTAIEKYLKSLLALRNLAIPHSHNVTHLDQLIKSKAGFDLSLNKSYLSLLQKTYKLRYPDDVKDGFNIALNQARLIVELDRTVQKIINRFHIVRADQSEQILLILERAMKDNDTSVLTNNAALDPSMANKLFSTASRSYDFRCHKGQIYETTYVTKTVEDGPEHELGGFAVVSDLQFTVAYAPIDEGLNTASLNGVAQVRVSDQKQEN